MIVDHSLQQRLHRAGKVAVLAGGRSSERDISLMSGQAVLEGLHTLGVDATLVDTAVTPINTLSKFDRVFPMLHGPGGEDGTIQGCLEYMGLPYVGSGVMASAIGMDKLRCKWLWQGAGLPTPAFCLKQEEVEAVGFPVMVKPVNEGSSIGMNRVDEPARLAAAIEEAEQYDDEVLIERCITGPEFTVAILGGDTLPPIRLETDNRFYDFNAKYESDETRYCCPCKLPAEQEALLRELALKAFRQLGCRHWGRIDAMQDSDGNFYLLEVNTVPGMTDHSLVPMAAREAGLTFPELVGEMLAMTLVTGES